MHVIPRMRFAIPAFLASLFIVSSSFASTSMLAPSPFSNTSLSPDGNHIVTFENNQDGVQKILIIDTVTMKSSPLSVSDGKGGLAHVTDIRWAGNEHIVFLANGENDANWLHTYGLTDRFPNRIAKEGKRSLIRTIPGSTRYLVLEQPSSDSPNQWTVLEFDATSDSDPIVRYETTSKSFECVADTLGRIRLVKKDDDTGNGLAWYHIDPATASETRLEKLYHWIRVLGIQADSNHAIVAGNLDTELPSISVFDLVADKPIQVLADNEDFSVVDYGKTVFDPAKGNLVGLFIDSATRASFWTDNDLARIQASIDEKLPGSINRIIGWSEDRNQLLVHRFVASLPSQYIHVNLAAEKFSVVLINGGRVKPNEVGVTRLVEIPNRSGAKMSTILTMPPNPSGSSKKHPLLIWIRKGIWNDLDRAEWHAEANYFASEGFIVVRINYSGSQGLLGKLAINTQSVDGVNTLFTDLEDAAKALVDAGIVDPEKICIGGEGEGAWAAAYAPIASPGRYRAVLCFNGVYDLPAYRNDGNVGGGNYLSFANQGSLLSDEQVAAFSVTQNIDSYPKDLFVAYGKWSDDAHKSQASAFAKAAKKAKSSVKTFSDDWWGGSLSGAKRVDAFSRASAVLKSATK